MQSVSQMNGMQTFGYPSSAVKVGSSWQVDFDAAEAIRKMAPQAKANGKMPIKMRVTGIRRQGGLTLVDLAVAMTGNMNFAGQGQSITSKITGNGSVSIDAATGMPVTQTMKQVMVTAFGKQSMTSTTTISMRKL